LFGVCCAFVSAERSAAERSVPFSSGQRVAIQSVANPNSWLRMDGSTCFSPQDAGCGSVNAQYYSTGTVPPFGGFEDFTLIQTSPISWCVASSNSPNALLRLDGSGCGGAGCGFVNAQYYPLGAGCANYEVFNIIGDGFGHYEFENIGTWPNDYIRMSIGCTSFAAGGCGVVNAEHDTGSPSTFALFNIIPLSSTTGTTGTTATTGTTGSTGSTGTTAFPCSQNGNFRTQSDGDWGDKCSEGFATGCYRDAHFGSCFPSGLTVGCTCKKKKYRILL